MEFVRRIYEDGKVTIPKELRELQGIQAGDYVKLSIVAVIPATRQVTQGHPEPHGIPEPEKRKGAGP